MESMNHPLSNMQIELLKLFSRDIEENDLKDLKRLIVKYLSERLLDKADKHWDDNNLDNEAMKDLLKTHLRTPYTDKK